MQFGADAPREHTMPSTLSTRIDGLAELKPRRILCCQLRQIGDALLLTPSITMLRRRYPDAVIDVLTEKKCAPVLENNPDIHHVWAFDHKMGFFECLRYYRKVGTGGGQGRYDMIVDFQQLPRIRWVIALSDAPVKLTFSPPWYNQLFYTHWVPVTDGYAAECKAGVLTKALGLPWVNDPPRLCLTEAERESAKAELAAWGLKADQRLITVDPTHRRLTRQWPARHYAKLLALTALQRPDLCFLLLYGPGELEMAAKVRTLALEAGLPPERIILPPRLTSLREMAAMQAQAALHLGNCSSPRHIAVGVGTKTFTVRGSTSAAWTFPGPGHVDVALGLSCQPCCKNTCSIGNKCLEELEPEVVLPQLLALLDE